jgi:hypothetical protein
MKGDRLRVDLLVRKTSGWYRIACFDFASAETVREVINFLNEKTVNVDEVIDPDKLLINWGVANP